MCISLISINIVAYDSDLLTLEERTSTGYGFQTISMSDASLNWNVEDNNIYVSSADGIWQLTSSLMEVDFLNEFESEKSWHPKENLLFTRIADEKGIYHISNHIFVPLENFDERMFFVGDIAWSLNAPLVAVKYNQRRIGLWNTESGEPVTTIESDIEHSSAISLNADGSLLVLAGSNGAINFYDVSTGEKISTDTFGTDSIRTLIWHPQESWLIGMNAAGVIFRINFNEGTGEIIEIGRSLITEYFRMEWSPDESMLAIYGNVLSIVSTTALQEELTINDFIIAELTVSITDIAWSPDSRQMVSIDRHGFLSIWEIDTTNKRLMQSQTLSGGHTGEIVDIEWSPDGQYLATTSSRDDTIRIWDVEQDGTINNNYIGEQFRNELSWSPDGQYLATTAEGNQIQILSMPDGDRVNVIGGGEHFVNDLDWHPNGQVIAIIDSDYVLNILTAQDGEMVTSHRLPYWINVVRWNDSGDRLFVGGDDGLAVILDVSNNYEIVEQNYLYNLDFIYYFSITNADWYMESNLIAISSSTYVTLWSGEYNEARAQFTTPINALTFGSDSTILFTANREGDRIRALDIISGEELVSLEVQNPVAIDWDKHHNQLAVGDQAGRIYIFGNEDDR